MNLPAPIPKIVAPGTGKKLSVVGDSNTILLAGEDTGGTLALIETTAPPGVGPPLHIHHREDETFAILEGEFEFQVDGEVYRPTQGSVVFAPKGRPHRFQNVGPTPGRMLISLTPAGLENFFIEVDQVPPDRQLDLERLAAIARKYELELLI